MKRAGRSKTRGEPVRFAVIGQGFVAQGTVLPAFKEADGCELRAIFSNDRTKLRALKRKRAAESGRLEEVERIARRARPSKAQAIRRKPHGMPQLIHAQPAGRG